jgi:DNA-binding NarL/FixJ family response regulator
VTSGEETPGAGCLLLADRHQGLLEGIQGLLRSLFDAVVTVSDEYSLIEIARKVEPDLAVLDLALAPDGLAMIRRLRASCPDQRVILLSPHEEDRVADAARRAGVQGFVLKRRIAEDLIPAAEAVLAGGRYPAAPAVGAFSRSAR